MHTPVLPTDHVGDVLSRDLALIDVFVRHSPHFAKLRNPMMRRTMARLVTVEHAARIAGVPADTLVRALNEALGIDGGARAIGRDADAAPADHATAAPPSQRPADAREVELDVRDDLRSGREPFSRIMAAVAALADGDALHLRTIFEPVPLYAVLRKRGFAHEAHAHALDDWSVWFWRTKGEDAAHSDDASRSSLSAPAPAAADAGATTAGSAAPRKRDTAESDETWLDVRGLEPPEPMVRTLAALETLPAGHTLVQVNVRVPQFLLPILAERGFAYQVDETRPEHVLVRIRRSA